MHAAHRERGVLVVFVLFLLAFPFATRAAELTFSPPSGSFAAGEEFSIKIQVNPGTDSVNAADGTLSFDSTLLSVASLSKDGSAFSLWTAEPEFSNSAGTVTFSGGTPTAFSSQKAVLTVNFTAKTTGTATVSFTKGSILAADGKGTDVYVAGAPASYTITEGSAEADEVEGDASAALPAPAIASATHPKEDLWYATSTVEFSWKMPSDATGVRTIFSDKEDEKPDFEQEEGVMSETLVDIADGVWYAYAQFKSDLGWGEVGRRTIRIDTTPPSEFDIALVEGDTPKFTFQAEDTLSGIDRYEIFFGETSVGTAKAQDMESGGFPVPAQEGGPQKVVVKAFDKAGNVREISKDMTLPKVAKVNKAKAGEEEEEPSFFTIERILLILFAMGIGALATLNFYARKNADTEKERILREVAQVRDKNDKVFSALREEFEEMVNNFDEKPQLTPQERDFLENIKEALDISEEVVDTTMEELKKTIRG
jgi:hypothetical protein